MFSTYTFFGLLIFIAGLFIGRGLYCAVLFFEGRRKISFFCCPSCHRLVGIFPVVSRFFNLGYCSFCKRRIDVRQTILEIVTAVALINIYLQYPYSWMGIEISLFTLMALVAASVDLKRTLLPDTCTLGGILVALLGAYLNPEREFMNAFLGLCMGGGFFLLIGWMYYFLRRQEGIGGGDIKMMAWVGALVGFQGVFKVILLSSVLGLIYGFYLLLRRGQGWMTGVPFGPYIAFSTYTLLVFFKDTLDSCLVYLCIF